MAKYKEYDYSSRKLLSEKIVASVEEDLITIETSYPLKKGRKK